MIGERGRKEQQCAGMIHKFTEQQEKATNRGQRLPFFRFISFSTLIPINKTQLNGPSANKTDSNWNPNSALRCACIGFSWCVRVCVSANDVVIT